jgi:hypothetical protein
MTKPKTILTRLAVFLPAAFLAFYSEISYRRMVRFFFQLFQDGKIKFIGKNFHFPDPYFIISFGLYCVLLSVFLTGLARHKSLKLVFTLLIFFVATLATTYIDSMLKVAECTACRDGVRTLHFNAISYLFHFITGLLLSLLPFGLPYFKRNKHTS